MTLSSKDLSILKFISRGRTIHQKIRKECGVFQNESVTTVNRLSKLGYVKKVADHGWKIEITESGLELLQEVEV